MKRLVLIADDPASVRTIRLALRNAGALRVVASIDGRWSAREPIRDHAPDVVVVDEMCQQPYARMRMREVSEEAPHALLVLLTSGLGPASLENAFETGAHAVVSRHLHSGTLGTLLRELADGAVFHAPYRPRVPAADAQEARTSA